ncbi:MAG: TonB-dependent receptor plug domain-containing protein [Gammaproteobacteria bacterium]|nr:TonB-dependent receptor plug domain-containing protein [Pseudomonadales bacterium]MCP5349197.1 TonB-dependent receptor plug domain-containing protein [Pseudomonadales bacterium]
MPVLKCFSAALTRSTFLTLISTLTILATGQAIGQDTSDDGSTVIYPANYFDQWAPLTAQDMLNRIPGQTNSGGGGGGPRGPGGGNPSAGGRGLGSGSGGTDILIDGKRTAGKNNQTEGLLSRIPADQVQEIQIIRGTSGELDVRGSGQVINVVLFEALSSNSVSWDATAAMAQDGNFTPSGSVALSGQRGDLNYLLSLRSNPRYTHSRTFEHSILGDFSPNDTVLEHRINDQDNNELSMNLGFELSDNSSMRLNALYAVRDTPTTVDRYTTSLRTTPASLTVEKEDNPYDRDNWELGGDYELSLKNGNRFKVLGIANRTNQDSTRQRFKLQDDNVFQKNLYLNTNSVTEERILRSSYTMDVLSEQNVEFGIERAQTILDSRLSLGLLSSTGTPSEAVGGLVPQHVSNANSRVEEIRYEPFIIHNWTISPKMSLESTLLWEFSEISQTGDVRKTRQFDFIKPKIDLRYDLTPYLQLRGTIERIVNQLSFSDFVASNDDQDNDRNTVAGNANLRQETQWRYTFNTEYRLPNDVGVLNTRIFYADHQDVIDRIDVSPSDTNIQSANGNIGDGWEYGADMSASIRMGMIGLPNLLVSPTLLVQDSEVTDPFLGIERRFQYYIRGQFTLTIRHDIPQWRFNWGFQNFDRIDGGLFRYDVDDIEFEIGDPRYNLFAEYVDRRNLTYRIDIQNASNNVRCRRRTRYAGKISSGILSEIENQCTHTGLDFSLKVSGTF